MKIGYTAPGELRRYFRANGVKIGRLSARRLHRLGPRVHDLEKRFLSAGGITGVKKVVAPRPSKLDQVDFRTIPSSVFSRCLRPKRLSRGNREVLDLRAMKKVLEAEERANSYTDEEGGLELGAIVDKLDEVSKDFRGLLSSKNTTIEDVITLIDESREGLGFRSAVLTYPNPERSHYWIRQSSDDRGKLHSSGYDITTGGQPPETTIKSIIDAPGEKLVFVVDIAKGRENTFYEQGLVLSPTRDKDLECFIGPTEMLFVRLKTRKGVVGVLQLHNRVKQECFLGERSISHMLPRSEPDRRRVLVALESFFREAVRTIEKIQERNDNSIISAETMLQPMKAVEREEDSIVEMMSGNSKPTEKRINTSFYKLVQRKCVPEKLTDRLVMGRIENPSAALTQKEQALLIAALNWTGRDEGDMFEHVVKVAEVEIIFDGNRPISFATGNELVSSRGKKTEMLEYLVATMNRKGYYNRGLQTIVNGKYLTRRWWQTKLGNLFKFVKVIPMMRSRSVGPIAGFLKYFSSVKLGKLSDDELRRAKEFARFMGCSVDENGIVRNAYSQSPTDEARDDEILENIRKTDKKLYHKIKSAMDGLGSNDARIFQGKLTWWKLLIGNLYVWLVLKRQNKDKDKKKH